MIIGLIGESCVGKSTLATSLKEKINAEVYSGKDYLRMAKSEVEAEAAFKELLSETDKNIIYVISEKEHLKLLPNNALRVLVTADISIIKERFAKRTGGILPPPLANMLDKKHGMFNNENCDVHIVSDNKTTGEACSEILQYLVG